MGFSVISCVRLAAYKAVFPELPGAGIQTWGKEVAQAMRTDRERVTGPTLLMSGNDKLHPDWGACGELKVYFVATLPHPEAFAKPISGAQLLASMEGNCPGAVTGHIEPWALDYLGAERRICYGDAHLAAHYAEAAFLIEKDWTSGIALHALTEESLNGSTPVLKPLASRNSVHQLAELGGWRSDPSKLRSVGLPAAELEQRQKDASEAAQAAKAAGLPSPVEALGTKLEELLGSKGTSQLAFSDAHADLPGVSKVSQSGWQAGTTLERGRTQFQAVFGGEPRAAAACDVSVLWRERPARLEDLQHALHLQAHVYAGLLPLLRDVDLAGLTGAIKSFANTRNGKGAYKVCSLLFGSVDGMHISINLKPFHLCGPLRSKNLRQKNGTQMQQPQHPERQR
jgi:hypothetical protein